MEDQNSMRVMTSSDNLSKEPEQINTQIQNDNNTESTESHLQQQPQSLLKTSANVPGAKETPSQILTAQEMETQSFNNKNDCWSNPDVQSRATDENFTPECNSQSVISENISSSLLGIPDAEICSTRIKAEATRINIQSKEDKRRFLAKKTEYCGLQNQGATCYLNAVLQSLFMTEDFRKAIMKLVGKRKGKKNRKPKSVSIELQDLFKRLMSNDRSVTTEGITKALAIGNVCEEQDAAEFLQKILSMIEPEPSEIFHGKKKHSSTCLQSQHESIEEINSFCFLAIAMDSDQHVINVQKSFNSQFEATLLEGEDQLYCENCQMMTDMKISYTVLQVPQVLVLQMQRFNLDYYSMTFLKNNRDVEIPLHLSVQDEGGVHYVYDLYAVINHSGSLSGGHYFANIKSFENQQWYQFNDSSVHRIQNCYGVRHSKKHFISSTACLLFFRKSSKLQQEMEDQNSMRVMTSSDNLSKEPEQINTQIQNDNNTESTESHLQQQPQSLLKTSANVPGAKETPSQILTAQEMETQSFNNKNDCWSNPDVQSRATDENFTPECNSQSVISENISSSLQGIPDAEICSTRIKAEATRINIQSKEDKRRFLAKKTEYCGLQNQGATCYLNAVLQSLFMTEDFRKAIMKLNGETRKQKCLSFELQDLFKCLESREGIVTTKGITNALDVTNVCEEQDAAEFLQKILSMIEPEPSEIFHGKKKHSSTCLQSQHESIEEINSFCFLAIAMDSDQHVINVQKSFNSQFEATLLEGEDQLYCENCQMMTDMKISYTILQVPQVLVLQMQRFNLDYYSMTFLKNNCDVEIPLHLSVQDEGGVHYVYDLYAVINHSGSLSGGHYFANIKSFENQQWYQFNDSSVHRIRKFDGGRHLQNHFVSDMACLLFFKKSSAQPRAHTQKEMDIPSSTKVMTSSKSESPSNTLTKTHNSMDTEKPHNLSQKTEEIIIKIDEDNSESTESDLLEDPLRTTETAEHPPLFPPAPETKMLSADNKNGNQLNLNMQSSSTDGSFTAVLNSQSVISDNISIYSRNMSKEDKHHFPAKKIETPGQHSQTANSCSEVDDPTSLKERSPQNKKTKGSNLQTTEQTDTAIQNYNYESTEKNLPQHLPSLLNTKITETENKCSAMKTVYINSCESELNTDTNTDNDEGNGTQSNSLLGIDESAQKNEHTQNVSWRKSPYLKNMIYFSVILLVFILLLVLLLTLV
ncbi:uncharacterized protein LOC127437100 isoform X2 [Myxocyprinus asiaticus]|nr:uncharacterized protein LOC127437100 isoform X2 [Myxocyprinus asiaticus]